MTLQRMFNAVFYWNTLPNKKKTTRATPMHNHNVWSVSISFAMHVHRMCSHIVMFPQRAGSGSSRRRGSQCTGHWRHGWCAHSGVCARRSPRSCTDGQWDNTAASWHPEGSPARGRCGTPGREAHSCAGSQNVSRNVPASRCPEMRSLVRARFLNGSTTKVHWGRSMCTSTLYSTLS